MSPEQLKTLKSLSELFESGHAGPNQIKLLSELLATINLHQNEHDVFFDESGIKHSI